MMTKRNKKSKKAPLISRGRPPIFKATSSLSSKATRNIIRSHHTLQKQRTKAIADGDDVKAAVLMKQIEAQGGIEGYQKASLLGQSRERGGDSSKILLEWLKTLVIKLRQEAVGGPPLRMLEIGALSSTNACTTCNLFEVERIDLNSQIRGIKKQDFMKMPIPIEEKDKFDIISMSLVLNFVPDAIGKGDMLLRTLKFLTTSCSEKYRDLFPCLFLVLPAPCVMNSRYLDDDRLKEIMESLGYSCVRYKLSRKLVYYLWRLETLCPTRTRKFGKKEVRSGGTRNNFAIILN
ncbi:25S rRNA adenine-N methyltransferase [Golovinomyces cichoracearum]|uniref:25S rRNA adenine-N(1) methyltransferase n=1 Tax=Golovinomyces cichoracearum TaxID=62708 RepID=A0A420HNM0_9PEZI|nr:25S rRNA adenine-N methyltransferase [Golovinomyces cichoracearum]